MPHTEVQPLVGRSIREVKISANRRIGANVGSEKMVTSMS